MQHTITISIPDTLEQRFRAIDDVDAFVSVITVEALQECAENGQTSSHLEKAAQLMLHDYTTDEELISFTVLDGEPIYE